MKELSEKDIQKLLGRRRRISILDNISSIWFVFDYFFLKRLIAKKFDFNMYDSTDFCVGSDKPDPRLKNHLGNICDNVYSVSLFFVTGKRSLFKKDFSGLFYLFVTYKDGVVDALFDYDLPNENVVKKYLNTIYCSLYIEKVGDRVKVYFIPELVSDIHETENKDFLVTTSFVDEYNIELSGLPTKRSLILNFIELCNVSVDNFKFDKNFIVSFLSQKFDNINWVKDCIKMYKIHPKKTIDTDKRKIFKTSIKTNDTTNNETVNNSIQSKSGNETTDLELKMFKTDINLVCFIVNHGGVVLGNINGKYKIKFRDDILYVRKSDNNHYVFSVKNSDNGNGKAKGGSIIDFCQMYLNLGNIGYVKKYLREYISKTSEEK